VKLGKRFARVVWYQQLEVRGLTRIGEKAETVGISRARRGARRADRWSNNNAGMRNAVDKFFRLRRGQPSTDQTTGRFRLQHHDTESGRPLTAGVVVESARRDVADRATTLAVQKA
jgi:hypothetical protein